MMLKDDFYSIVAIECNETKIHATIKIEANHVIFAGHFPGNPVTPGVVEMELVKEIVSECLKKKIKLTKMSNCKFLAILNPLHSSLVRINIDIIENYEDRIRISGQILDDHTVFMKISAEYIIV